MNKSIVTAVLDWFAGLTSHAVSLAAGLLAASFVVFGGAAVYDSLYISQTAKSPWEVLQYRPEIIEDGETTLMPSELAAINDDYRGWLTVYDTGIDYPVMQGGDDLYYASHDVFKSSSLSGAIYLAAANSADFSDDYNLLYGHHMDNGAMFGDLDEYAEAGYFNSRREGVLVTEEAVYDLYVFALVSTDAYESAIYDVGNRNLAEVVAYARENAVQYDESVSVGGKVLAMSTCESEVTNGRLVLLATMTERPGVQRGESIPTPTPAPSAAPGNAGSAGSATPASGGTPAQEVDASPSPSPSSSPGAAEVTERGGTTEASPAEAEEETPAADERESVLQALEPRADAYDGNDWALVNLAALILTAYLFLPVNALRAKFSRRRLLKREAAKGGSEDEAAAARLQRFSRRYWIGLTLEAVITAAALIVFLRTENLRMPMVLIDKYTLPMLLLLGGCWLADVLLIRLREDAEEPEDAEELHAE